MQRIAVAVLAIVGVISAAPTSGPSPRTVPVTRCQARLGVEGVTPPPVPTRERAVLTAAAASQLRFYSDGFVTVLAPRSWTCAGLAAADGGLSLSVFPAHEPDPLRAHLPANASAVTVFIDYTEHGPGAQLVCTLFPGTSAAALAAQTGGCGSPAAGESVARTGAGLARFDDPPGVLGVGVPSGGANRAVGAVVYPQPASAPASVTVTKVTCTAPPAMAKLCQTVVDDYLSRLPVGQGRDVIVQRLG